MRDFVEEHFGFFFCLVIVSLFVFLWWLSYREKKEWEQFVVDNNCHVVAKTSRTDVGTGVSMDGSVTVVVTPVESTGWLCDDGVTYYR